MTILLEKQSAQVLGSAYWERLRSLGRPFDTPVDLWVRSSAAWQSEPRSCVVAIVGTRRPTSYGLRFVADFVRELRAADSEAMIVSGGALGVDAWAHESALREGLRTESWVVGPVRDPNPRSHRALFTAIASRADGSAVICPDSLEPVTGETPFKSDWVERNAYLVARAQAVVVPEATERSGTWSSVRWANRLGIPVFALPGPVDCTSSSGTNLMISSGYAHPVGGATKLIEDLVVEGVVASYNDSRGATEKLVAIGELERRLCRSGGLQVVDLPGLSAQLGLKLETLCEYLLSELRSGKLRRVGNGFERRG
ncbi:MAG TPA: DNA-processing protein DprA [Bdellovibrionota bacterium]|nr:DNA-processing protein DprA [Bdellovibrionota bacterium]